MISLPHHGQEVIWWGVPVEDGLPPTLRWRKELAAAARRIRRGLVADPQTKAERRLAPLGHIGTADGLAGAHQRRRTLELLQGQQAQGVAHQHRNAMVAAAPLDLALEPAQGQRVGGQAQIGFGLAAAGGEPQQIGHRIGFMAAVGVVQVGEAGQVEQHEGHLEQTPASVLRHVQRGHAVFDRHLLLAHLARAKVE